MQRQRSEFLEDMKDISDYSNARRGRFLNGDWWQNDRKSRRRATDKVINERMLYASRTCGAGMLSGVSSPSRPWLKLSTPDKDLNEYYAVKRWLDFAEKRVYQVFAASNYYHVKQSSYKDMADYGQGPVLIDQDFEDVVNCYCSPPGEYYLGVDRKGRPDTLYRDLYKSTKDIVEEFWDAGRIPREVRESYDRGQYDQMWLVVSAVQPNIRMTKGERGPRGMPFSHMNYMPTLARDGDQNVLSISGYHSNPISAPRWDVPPGDIYGDGCGIVALPGTKSLQILERRKGQLIDKLATPPSQAPAEMETQGKVISHAPGGMSYYPTNLAGQSGRGAISPIYQIDPASLPAVGAESETLERRVDVAYYVDLFLATIAANRNAPNRAATAREIGEVHEEKLIALGPVLERTHYEGLSVDILRALDILQRANALPPPPPELQSAGLKIEFTSLLAVAQRAVGATAIERFVGFVGNMLATDAADPTATDRVMDKWNRDQTIDEYADVTGVPASMVRSDEEVAKLRADRAKQMQQAQAAQAVVQGADTAKVLSEADSGRNSNLLADIIGNQGRIV